LGGGGVGEEEGRGEREPVVWEEELTHWLRSTRGQRPDWLDRPGWHPPSLFS
jgi:hypothetical protein